MGALDGWRGARFEVAPTIFFEFHGGPAAVEEQLAAAEALIAEYGGREWRSATRQEERTALWKARHNAFWAIKDKWPGLDLIATDVAVPVSKLAELVQLTKDHLDELGIVAAPIFGHVGDGSFHVLPMFDSSEPEQVDKVRELEATMTRRAIESDGAAMVAVTRTLAGITQKQALLGLPSGHIYGLHKAMFDARRCVTE